MTGNRANYLPQLDALRGIACLMVLVAHLKTAPWLAWVPNVVGVAGVGLFFALSGFLITRGLLVDGNLAKFYNRRVMRVLPIYYLLLTILAVTWPGKQLLWAADFSFNLRFLADPRDYFFVENRVAAAPPVAHLWSLCVEEHFYWFWPILVACFPRRVIWIFPAAIIIGTAPATYFLGEHLLSVGLTNSEISGLINRSSPTQLVAISFGTLVAIAEPSLNSAAVCVRGTLIRNWMIVAIAVIGLTAEWGTLLWWWNERSSISAAAEPTMLHLICGVLFLIGLQCPRLGSFFVLREVGKISYGLYLYHLPVYALLGFPEAAAEFGVVIAPVAVLLTFLFATLSYQLIEEPLIRFGKQTRIKSLGCGITGLILVICAHSGFAIFQQFNLGGRPIMEDPALTPVDPGLITSIVVGTSHAQLGVASPELTDVNYNCALNDQDLWYSCEIARKCSQDLPNIRRVIFTISVFSFRRSVADQPETQWVEAVYFHSWGLRSRLGDVNRERYLPKRIDNDNLRIAKTKAHFGDDRLRGWLPLDVSFPLNMETAKGQCAMHTTDFMARINDNKQILINAILELHDRGIESVMISTPKHHFYRDQLDADYVAETAAATDEVVSVTKVRFLDYTADPRFFDEDYKDENHLNRTGAIKFTRILDEDLNRQPSR